MKQISSAELREMFQSFMESKGHHRIHSASVIPENDPTVLFTTAGMHPLVPYLMGQKHPQGNRLTNVQKCIRTGDIDDVGDASHLTFFEMMGNWSLGDYFKKEMIPWSWEFLTSGKYLDIDPRRLAFSVFAGDDNAPRDDESHELWLKCGVDAQNIYYLPKENNWWGPAVKIMDRSMIATPWVRDKLFEAAEAAGVSVQREVLAFGGTDGGAIQKSRGGVPTGTLSIPCRYVHSANEVIDMRDMEGALKVLLQFVDLSL